MSASTVDKETFAYWVTHPHDIGAGNLSRLEATARAFPYCQITHSLIAKVGADSASPQLHQYISRAAVHTLNRGALRRLVENEFAWSETLLNRINDLPLGRVASRENAAPYGNDKPISLIRFEDRFLKNTEQSERPEHSESQTDALPVDETIVSEKTIEEDLTHKRPIVAPIPAIELIPLPIPKEDDRRKQQEIIETFIRNDPRIGPIRPKADEPEKEQIDLSSRGKALPADGLITEAFAKILVRQGKRDKAIDIYEKLILKKPEKKDYFAEKIAELKEAK